MPSIFEEITKTVVRELDSGGNTIAVRSAIDADRFHCFYLVREKQSFFGSRYCKTDLTLKDILESENGERPIDEVDSVSPGQKAEFRISDDVDSKGEFSVKLPKTITSRGMAGWSQGTQGQEIKILVNRIPQQYLDSLVDRKLKKKLPRIFELVQARGEHLYLVTEALVTVNEETLRRERQFEFNSWMDWNIFGFAYKVSEVLVSGELQMENPAGPLISSLFNAAGILVEARADAIQALLDALMELSEEYQQFVFEALEKGMLPQLVEEVESTLEKKWDERYSNPHDMDSDSEAQSLYALYVALSILLQLCEKPTSASS
ncbi:gasdermin-B [Loxodonta africana]|uniref:gasdermin-B n=1 Tax=Loxodonta africana TaxID=9785 RepID=UPI0030D1048C